MDTTQDTTEPAYLRQRRQRDIIILLMVTALSIMLAIPPNAWAEGTGAFGGNCSGVHYNDAVNCLPSGRWGTYIGKISGRVEPVADGAFGVVTNIWPIIGTSIRMAVPNTILMVMQVCWSSTLAFTQFAASFDPLKQFGMDIDQLAYRLFDDAITRNGILSGIFIIGLFAWVAAAGFNIGNTRAVAKRIGASILCVGTIGAMMGAIQQEQSSVKTGSYEERMASKPTVGTPWWLVTTINKTVNTMVEGIDFSTAVEGGDGMMASDNGMANCQTYLMAMHDQYKTVTRDTGGDSKTVRNVNLLWEETALRAQVAMQWGSPSANGNTTAAEAYNARQAYCHVLEAQAQTPVETQRLLTNREFNRDAGGVDSKTAAWLFTTNGFLDPRNSYIEADDGRKLDRDPSVMLDRMGVFWETCTVDAQGNPKARPGWDKLIDTQGLPDFKGIKGSLGADLKPATADLGDVAKFSDPTGEGVLHTSKGKDGNGKEDAGEAVAAVCASVLNNQMFRQASAPVSTHQTIDDCKATADTAGKRVESGLGSAMMGVFGPGGWALQGVTGNKAGDIAGKAALWGTLGPLGMISAKKASHAACENFAGPDPGQHPEYKPTFESAALGWRFDIPNVNSSFVNTGLDNVADDTGDDAATLRTINRLYGNTDIDTLGAFGAAIGAVCSLVVFGSLSLVVVVAKTMLMLMALFLMFALLVRAFPVGDKPTKALVNWGRTCCQMSMATTAVAFIAGLSVELCNIAVSFTSNMSGMFLYNVVAGSSPALAIASIGLFCKMILKIGNPFSLKALMSIAATDSMAGTVMGGANGLKNAALGLVGAGPMGAVTSLMSGGRHVFGSKGGDDRPSSHGATGNGRDAAEDSAKTLAKAGGNAKGGKGRGLMGRVFGDLNKRTGKAFGKTASRTAAAWKKTNKRTGRQWGHLLRDVDRADVKNRNEWNKLRGGIKARKAEAIRRDTQGYLRTHPGMTAAQAYQKAKSMYGRNHRKERFMDAIRTGRQAAINAGRAVLVGAESIGTVGLIGGRYAARGVSTAAAYAARGVSTAAAYAGRAVSSKELRDKVKEGAARVMSSPVTKTAAKVATGAALMSNPFTAPLGLAMYASTVPDAFAAAGAVGHGAASAYRTGSDLWENRAAVWDSLKETGEDVAAKVDDAFTKVDDAVTGAGRDILDGVAKGEKDESLGERFQRQAEERGRKMAEDLKTAEEARKAKEAAQEAQEADAARTSSRYGWGGEGKPPISRPGMFGATAAEYAVTPPAPNPAVTPADAKPAPDPDAGWKEQLRRARGEEASGNPVPEASRPKPVFRTPVVDPAASSPATPAEPSSGASE